MHKLLKSSEVGPALENFLHQIASASEATGISQSQKDAFLQTFPKAGTTPVPNGYVRLYHQTNPQTLKQIKETGKIDVSKSTGKQNREPVCIWSSKDGFYDKLNNGRFYNLPTVEFMVPEKDQDIGRVCRSIESNEIIAYHEPWHQIAEYMVEEGLIPNALAGEYDSINAPEYEGAVLQIKRFFGPVLPNEQSQNLKDLARPNSNGLLRSNRP